MKLLALAPFACKPMNVKELNKVVQESPATPKMPMLFVGHGSPMNAIEENPFTKALSGIAATIDPAPVAILVVSAHWLTNGTFVNTTPNPEIIYDFGGFPDALFKVKYPVKGSPEMANSVSSQIKSIGGTESWGIDHGAWTILKHIYPKADIPVFQLSIDYNKPMSYHFDLAKQLAFMREKGVLIVGSGNIVHNLGLAFQKMNNNDKTPYSWANEFDAWIQSKIEEKNFQALVNYDKEFKNALLPVPTVDHYVPLLYVTALAGEKESISTIYEEVTYGAISMRTFKVG